MSPAIVQGCDGCPEFAYHMEPYVAWGEVRGEIRHNDCRLEACMARARLHAAMAGKKRELS